MDYWEKCISEAFDDAGIAATEEQIDTVASWIEGAHENYGMAHGHDFIANPLESEIERLKQNHTKELKDRDAIEFIYKRSVAQRRNVPVENVYIDGDCVLFDR